MGKWDPTWIFTYNKVLNWGRYVFAFNDNGMFLSDTLVLFLCSVSNVRWGPPARLDISKDRIESKRDGPCL